jgi:hypothetical protein
MSGSRGVKRWRPQACVVAISPDARLDALFEIERSINGVQVDKRDSVARFLDDGRIICLSNNAAERALRGIAFAR